MHFAIHMLLDMPDLPSGFTGEETYVYLEEFPDMAVAIKFVKAEAKRLMEDGPVRFKLDNPDNLTPRMIVKCVIGSSKSQTMVATIWHKKNN